ncbi:MAG: hypothetical protein ACREVN_10565 [Gammaproteobacteria bacterium]
MSRARAARLAAGLCVSVAPTSALAHGFAQRYDLPVPLGLYLAGSAAAVALSFVVVAFFLRGHRTVERYPRLDLLAIPVVRGLAGPVPLLAVRLLSAGLFALVIAAGLIGNADPFKNLAPVMVWVIWWVGMAYVSGLAGPLWALINPWKIVFGAAESIARRVRPGARASLDLPYPRRLGCWPAVILFAGFVWAELVWPSSDTPSALARAALVYSVITWMGMLLFGKHVWLRHGEAFSIVFGLLARFAPSEFRVTNRELCASCESADCRSTAGDCINCEECFERASRAERQFNLRPYAVGLLTARPVPASLMVFTLLMLSSVTFDGLLATPLWADVARLMLYSELLRPLVLLFQEITGDALSAVSTLALLAFLVVFQLAYLLFGALIYLFTPARARAGARVGTVSGLFVLSLVPIALAYHLAHYLSFLLIIGQYAIPLASDPFGFGWNLFGTRLYFIDIGIVDARFVWFTSVIAIVVGHIVAVFLAHVMALRTFRDRRAALLSQIPMLLAMIAYTMLSLWILAQPIVETG